MKRAGGADDGGRTEQRARLPRLAGAEPLRLVAVALLSVEGAPRRSARSGSAQALLAAARDVAALPDDDRKLGRIVCLHKAGDDAVDRFLEQASYIIARHGIVFDGTETTGDLLAALIAATDDAALLSLDESPWLQSDAWRGSLVH